MQRFLGERWAAVSAIQVAVALMTAFLTLFIALFAYFIVVGAQQTQLRFEERSSAAAQIVATNAYWISEVASQILGRVDAALGPAMSGNAADIRQVIEDLPTVVELYIIDADGNTIYSTVPGAEAVSITDREYFTAPRAGAQFYTSPMLVSRLTGDQIFVFSKRVERDGVFAGAIMVSYSNALLEGLWSTLDLDVGSTISFIRDDGQLMARFPPAEAPSDLSALPLFTDLLPASEHGTYISNSSPLDGIARVVSYYKVDGAPIIALASVASDQTWANFRGSIFTVIFIASPVLLGLGVGCWWIVVLLRRDSRQTEELTMLFREIHHRVKNNLQSVQALVGLQDIPDSAKQDLQSRFAAMAAMHEHIYSHDRYVDIDAHDFVPAVVKQVKAAYGGDVQLIYEVEHVSLGRDQATPLALLLSELVTNALKYAFPPGTPGTITIALSPGAEGYTRLIVRDDGVGMPENSKRTSMGMRLVKGVVDQLGGSYVFHNDGGTIFQAELRLAS